VQGVVKKWGNSAAVRIPASVLEAAHVRLDQAVDVREEGGRIVIEVMHPLRYDIDALVNAITDENRHDSVDMGPAVGQEMF
jgi:antitoxin MazE